MRIDALQYANWSEKIFRQLREGGVDAIHVTIAYHENFRETVLNFETWNRWFEQFPDLIMKGQWASDIDEARRTGRTAVFFGFQNPSPIEDDIGLVEIVHTLGARFMQLTYNNQSLLATGSYEREDTGITRMGRGRSPIPTPPRTTGRQRSGTNATMSSGLSPEMAACWDFRSTRIT